MRTKTLALSAVLGALGTASLVAQTNVYSLNAVGYINVTMPPGYSIVTCPLICGTDTEYASTYGGNPVTNDLNVVLNNDNGQYKNALVLQFINGGAFGNADSGQGANLGGGWVGSSSLPAGPWGAAGQSDIGQGVSLLPGQAVFFFNPNSLNGGASMSATFVGTVPQGSLTNVLVPGYNLVGSMVPVSGDLVLNSISGQFLNSVVNANSPTSDLGPAYGDYIETFDPTVVGGHQNAYTSDGGWSGSWSGGLSAAGNPATGAVSQGFFYYNAGKDGVAAQTINGTTVPKGTEVWVENFSVNP